MGLEIRKGVPIPKIDRTDGPKPVYPFAGMRVGDCFGLPHNGARSACGAYLVQNRIHTAARQWVIRNNKDWKFRVRTVGDEAICWRVK